MNTFSEGTWQEVLSGDARWCVEHGDAGYLLWRMPDDSVDSMVTDPPAAVSFMSANWDDDKGGREKWIAWLAEIMTDAWRVLKPGGHALIWALPRTSHWTGMALELAGFELVDCLNHLFGSGMPKSVNASKAIDEAAFRAWLKVNPEAAALLTQAKARAKELRKSRGTQRRGTKLLRRVKDRLKRRAGLLREVTGSYKAGGNAGTSTSEKGGTYGVGVANSEAVELFTSVGATEESRAWDGFGTGLKPGHECWWLVRKPLEGTIAAGVQKWGTGAINVDGCRVFAESETPPVIPEPRGKFDAVVLAIVAKVQREGRWPPNVLLTHDHRCQKTGTTQVAANPTWDTPNRNTEPSSFAGDEVSQVRHESDDSETVDVWKCVEGCPVREIGRQSGESLGNSNKSLDADTPNTGYAGFFERGTGGLGRADSGSAARYFPQFQYTELDQPFLYCAKPSRAETERGLEHFRARSGAEATSSEEGQTRLDNPRTGAGRTGGVRNVHPTKKAIELTRWLCRLVTPPGGVCLVPFAGSGSECIGALLEGFRVIGCEMNDTDAEPYVSIARARIIHIMGGTMKPRQSLRAADEPRQRSLFTGAAE